jgi:putative transposase
MAKPLILCSHSAVILLQHEGSSTELFGTNGVPERIAIDQSGANLAGLQSLNAILKFTETGKIINIVQSKYLNNMVEQDHCFKKITRPMLGFKAFYSAAATLAGIEVAHMIRRGKLGQNGMSPSKQFAALTG